MAGTGHTRAYSYKVGEPFILAQRGVAIGAGLISAGTTETLALNARLTNVPNSTVVLDAYVDVVTALTVDAAETFTFDLETTESTPQVIFNNVDGKTAARTDLVTGAKVKLAADAGYRLTTLVSGAGGVATAGVVDVYLVVMREDGVETSIS